MVVKQYKSNGYPLPCDNIYTSLLRSTISTACHLAPVERVAEFGHQRFS